MPLPARKAAPLPALPVNAEKELAQLEVDFGGRQYLVQALTFAKQSKDIRYVLGLIADPEHSSMSLAEICRAGRILPGELVSALASGAELRSQLLAKQHIARRVPTVVAEVMQKAAEYEDACTECLGTSPESCELCRGTGRLLFPADGKCRDLALEMAGLTGNTGAPSVSIVNQNLNYNRGGSSYEGFERMQEAMDQILYGADAVPSMSTEVVDAEAVPAPEEQTDGT